MVASGGLNKLEAYQRLKITEVWFWEDGTLSLYHLRTISGSTAYEQIPRSELMSGLDIAVLLRCINLSHHVEAVREFRSAIRESCAAVRLCSDRRLPTDREIAKAN